MSLRSPLGKVLGTGPAKEGVHHWWTQRLTSVALIPLGLGVAAALASLKSFDYHTVTAWIRAGITAPLLVLFIIVVSWHSQLGVRVVVEDYVHEKGAKALIIVFSQFAHVLAAAVAVFAVLKVAFTP
jgi:succinate dehydrogenase / fumarate reductase, membrane anchor subunit